MMQVDDEEKRKVVWASAQKETWGLNTSGKVGEVVKLRDRLVAGIHSKSLERPVLV